MGWSDWFSVGAGEEMCNKTTENDDGSRKEESLRTNDGDRGDHQHTWIDYNEDGEVVGGGATPSNHYAEDDK